MCTGPASVDTLICSALMSNVTCPVTYQVAGYVTGCWLNKINNLINNNNGLYRKRACNSFKLVEGCKIK